MFLFPNEGDVVTQAAQGVTGQRRRDRDQAQAIRAASAVNTRF
jgi:hypothetical protein